MLWREARVLICYLKTKSFEAKFELLCLVLVTADAQLEHRMNEIGERYTVQESNLQ